MDVNEQAQAVDTTTVSSSRAGGDNDLASLANTVRIACQRVSRRVRYDSADTLPPHQLVVLFHLTKGAMTPGDLASRERVSAPSMSKTVATLVESGLVVRTPDPDDGRRCLLVVTASGRAAVDDAAAHRDWFMIERLARLTQDERDLLAEAARLLNEVISA